MPLTKYNVGDLMVEPRNLKVLMVLESPHINEYTHGHPAAGESALELTQLLKSQGYVHDFDNQLPIGCNIKALNYKPLGILNCSTLPLNKAFYPCVLSSDDLSQVNELEAIKQGLSRNNPKELPIDLQKTRIFKDFEFRLTQVLEQAPADILIVPCGDTAIGFMDAFKTIYHKDLTVLNSLPHPTESDWAEKIATIDLTENIKPETLP